ncbi:MAG TPA: transcription antitermination factor NusB, partial [Candidatus Sulfotelmatobacter sp.]|nr:transcription antitermination factor NusB [Candidatus Sulfotelmatobacter sp.]
GNEIGQVVENLLAEEKYIPETQTFAATLARAAWADHQAADQIITSMSADWPLERIGKVDLSILRLAFYELKEGSTPASVVIDEAVELAKKYSTTEAAKFINGILGTYLRLRK